MRVFVVPAIEAAFAVHEVCLTNPGLELNIAVEALRRGPIENAEWDFDAGLKIIEHLSLEALTELTSLAKVSRWRYVLRKLTLITGPLWAIRLPQGRENTIAAMDVDTQQCLRYAGLIDRPLDNEGIEWWDGLAAEIRRLEDQRRLATGRQGERLSFEYERTRLRPFGYEGAVQWVSLENNALGYDILSAELIGEDLKERFIEVKACQYSPPQFYLTRNEWDVAKQKRESYVVHVWEVRDQVLRLIDFTELETMVPADSVSGKGMWQKARISLAALD